MLRYSYSKRRVIMRGTSNCTVYAAHCAIDGSVAHCRVPGVRPGLSGFVLRGTVEDARGKTQFTYACALWAAILEPSLRPGPTLARGINH